MDFMQSYFKKKTNTSIWSPSYQNKRKRDNVDVAVKRLKRVVLIEAEENKKDDDVKVVNKDVIVEKSSKVFPSFQLKNVTFMSKNLNGCLCQCSESGISIFLEDVFAQDSSIMLNFSDLESIALELKPRKLILKVKETKIDYLKNIFQLEPWNHNNCTDGVSSKLVLLNASKQESVEVVEQFYQHVNNHIDNDLEGSQDISKDALLTRNAPEDRLQPEVHPSSDDGYCVEVSTEIDVGSFYGTSKKTKGPKVEREPKRDSPATRSKKKCPECGGPTTSGKFGRNAKCRGCEKVDEKCNNSDSDILCNSPASEPKRLFEYPPPPAVGRISFTNHDRACLEAGEFFNDVNIDFYLKFFHQEVLSPKDRERTHIFSSFFYSHLTSDPVKVTPANKAKSRHQRVRNWTRNVDIFSKDFIIIPINQKYHWFLAIICFPALCAKQKEITRCCLEDDDDEDDEDTYKSVANSRKKVGVDRSGLDWIAGYESGSDENTPKKNKKDKVDQSSEVVKNPLILIFDSLSGGLVRWDVSSTLRQYLQIEWNEKKKCTNGKDLFNSKTLKGCFPMCPQQSNHYDCGPYLLLYVQHFFMSPITDYNVPIKKLKNWFSDGDADVFRNDLQALVDSLSKKQSETVSEKRSIEACNGEIIIS